MRYTIHFKSQGVSIVDHLTASKQFQLFEEKELANNRDVTGKWSWLAHHFHRPNFKLSSWL